MARPKKQTVDYFPHSCNHKKTMFIIEQRYGNDGYAFWFKLLETLGNSAGHFIDTNNHEDREYLAALARLDWDACADIICLLAKLGAVDKQLWDAERVVWSDNFIENIKDAYRNRVNDIPVKPGLLRKKPRITPQTYSKKPQTKLNKTKVNYTKVNNNVNSGGSAGDNSVKNVDNSNGPGSATSSKIYKAFSQNIHPITPMEFETLSSFVDEGLQEDVVVWAIKEAVIMGKRNARYIGGILKNLQKEGITTLEGAEARARDRADGVKSGAGSRLTSCPACKEKVNAGEIFIGDNNYVVCSKCSSKGG